MRASIVVLALAGVAAAACEGGSTSPGRVSSLVINGPDAIRTTLPTEYSLTATLSDGTTQKVTPVWTVSGAVVGSVDAAGRLTGHAHGPAELTASYQGRTVSKSVRIANNYGGSWTGRAIVRLCHDTRGEGGCLSTNRVGVEQGVSLRLTQTGSTLTEVAGTLTYYGSTSVTGVITDDGRLSLSGTTYLGCQDDSEDICAIFRVKGWESSLLSPGAMGGRWVVTVSSFPADHVSLSQENELLTMLQTAP